MDLAQQLDELTSEARLVLDSRIANGEDVDTALAAVKALNAVADDWPLEAAALSMLIPGTTVPDTGEADPTGRSPHTPGAKLDAGKPPVLRGAFQYFPRALKHVARVSAKGAAKYAWNGWEDVPDGINRYGDAMGRHITNEAIEGLYDKDTGELHAAQVAWNSLARLELILRAMEQQQ